MEQRTRKGIDGPWSRLCTLIEDPDKMDVAEIKGDLTLKKGNWVTRALGSCPGHIWDVSSALAREYGMVAAPNRTLELVLDNMVYFSKKGISKWTVKDRATTTRAIKLYDEDATLAVESLSKPVLCYVLAITKLETLMSEQSKVFQAQIEASSGDIDMIEAVIGIMLRARNL